MPLPARAFRQQAPDTDRTLRPSRDSPKDPPQGSAVGCSAAANGGASPLQKPTAATIFLRHAARGLISIKRSFVDESESSPSHETSCAFDPV